MLMNCLLILLLIIYQISFINGFYNIKILKKNYISNKNIDGTQLYLLNNNNNNNNNNNDDDENNNKIMEPMFSLNYDPLELPDSETFERDLEDILMERALRFYDKSVVKNKEKCYLVGLDDKSEARSDYINNKIVFTMEESLTELSELAGAAGLTVVGSTYQRMQKPDIQYYIGQISFE